MSEFFPLASTLILPESSEFVSTLCIVCVSTLILLEELPEQGSQCIVFKFLLVFFLGFLFVILFLSTGFCSCFLGFLFVVRFVQSVSCLSLLRFVMCNTLWIDLPKHLRNKMNLIGGGLDPTSVHDRGEGTRDTLSADFLADSPLVSRLPI